MSYVMCFLLFSLVFGLVAVASNPSPYFAALGLVVVSCVGCGLLVGHGGSFLSLVLFLIYLGGMLVVFSYSAALAAEPFPESLGSRLVVRLVVSYLVGLLLVSLLFKSGWHEFSWVPAEELDEFFSVRGDVGGVALIYSSGGAVLLISGWVLLLTLFVVLELTRGLSRGSIRAI
uniref:NADH dehydrogenase subunit 6 n=1 Tax=Betta coccina TaxID=209211 RepID=UPI00257FB772|nr:NADH dehydrogenase subunit 6 [Betta coccina]WGV34522.1 NADH dehydrogenase subunit 6 [Betta coccina]